MSTQTGKVDLTTGSLTLSPSTQVVSVISLLTDIKTSLNVLNDISSKLSDVSTKLTTLNDTVKSGNTSLAILPTISTNISNGSTSNHTDLQNILNAIAGTTPANVSHIYDMMDFWDKHGLKIINR